ncbi:glutaminase liver isoform, mitochondrial [Polymixia lowei]
MENSPGQEAEDSPYLCFQRTPSLRRKWRKRYGGLDGNKLLEPNKDQDIQALSQSVSKGLKPPVAQPEDRAAPPPRPWSPIARGPHQQGPSSRRLAADMLFDSFSSDGKLNTSHFFEAVCGSGLNRSDPRIRECLFHLRRQQETEGVVDRVSFHRCVKGFVSLLLKALQGQFVIPDFSTFTEETQKLFARCKQLASVQGRVKEAVDNARWAVSICTVDGQRLSLGDSAEPLILGEVSWPLIYGLAVEMLGGDQVHRYVGVEEFSRYPSPFTLSHTGTPHCPFTETGAIVTAVLLQMAVRSAEEEEYDSVLNLIQRLSNKEHGKLNCSSLQSSREEKLRLHALSFYLQENKCFPEKADISAALDIMLQCASTEITCESGAVMAASLANGGLCPLSGEQVLSPAATRSMLSMMQVAGMKDYSRSFHFKTSVPAMSGTHGPLLAVLPGVLGLMCFSPGSDAFGNPWRAVHFCQELVSTFQFHSFDIRTPLRQLLHYRQWKAESEGYQIINILLAAFRGDVPSLRRYFLSGGDVNAVDYDGRSALHLAAAEGHTEVIRFLVENAGASHAPKDRWGSTPLEEARRHKQAAALRLLQKYQSDPPNHPTLNLKSQP